MAAAQRRDHSAYLSEYRCPAEMLGASPASKEAVPTSPGVQESPNFDLILIEGQDELKKILDGPLEEWRIFLHPYQRYLKGEPAAQCTRLGTGILKGADWEEVWLSMLKSCRCRKKLQREYELVIDPNGIDDEEAYLTAIRSGRPRVSRQQRRAAWSVFRAFQRSLKKRNLLTFDGAIHEARYCLGLISLSHRNLAKGKMPIRPRYPEGN